METEVAKARQQIHIGHLTEIIPQRRRTDHLQQNLDLLSAPEGSHNPLMAHQISLIKVVNLDRKVLTDHKRRMVLQQVLVKCPAKALTITRDHQVFMEHQRTVLQVRLMEEQLYQILMLHQVNETMLHKAATDHHRKTMYHASLVEMQD